jgi:PIN domain nuclease of toxin-antitoxin system
MGFFQRHRAAEKTKTIPNFQLLTIISYAVAGYNAIAMHSALLPGSLHSDPADRILVATALRLGAQLITKDDKLHPKNAACAIESTR